MLSATTPLNVALSDPERSNSRTQILHAVVSCIGAEVITCGYTGSPTAQSDLTLRH